MPHAAINDDNSGREVTRLYSRSGYTRGEFFARIGATREVDALVDIAYKKLNERDFATSDQGAAAEDKWHVSFHGSEFPGDNPYGCGRYGLYRLLDVPRQVFTRKGRQYMDTGKDLEERLVWAWYNAGLLVSNPPNLKQTMYEDPQHWLTSTVDAILVKPRSDAPFVAEVKNVSYAAIEQMRNLVRGPADQHVRQINCQIGLAHEAGPLACLRCHNTGAMAVSDPFVCPLHGGDECLHESILDPVNYGRLYYVSRDNPMDTFEYMYEYNPGFMEAGRKQLAQWREAFEQDKLPATNYDDKRYSHPFGWKWTLDQYPCKWCDYGDICRDDHDASKEQGGPIKLHESAAVEVAQRFRPEWSYEDVKNDVYKRWGLGATKGSRARRATSQADAA